MSRVKERTFNNKERKLSTFVLYMVNIHKVLQELDFGKREAQNEKSALGSDGGGASVAGASRACSRKQ